MTSWTTITVKRGLDYQSPSDLAREATRDLDAAAYRRTELDEDHALITLYRTELLDDLLDALFGEYGNRYLCPGAVTVKAEDTGDSRTARVVRPPEKGEGLGTWSSVHEREWIDRPDEGAPDVDDQTATTELEAAHDLRAEVTHYGH